jgi:probable rRNA maturation factor
MSEPEISIEIAFPGWLEKFPDIDERCHAAAAVAFAAGVASHPLAQRQGPLLIDILLTDDTEMQELNRDWRGQDKPTNVLSFAALDDDESPLPPEPVPVLLGDIAIGFETVEREAKEQGKVFADHLAHMIVHGILHLLGYDHESEAEALAMETLERTVLTGMGAPDPYMESS